MESWTRKLASSALEILEGHAGNALRQSLEAKLGRQRQV